MEGGERGDGCTDWEELDKDDGERAKDKRVETCDLEVIFLLWKPK